MNYYEIIRNLLREAVSPVTTLLAAFFGAWFAYRFQNKAKEKEILNNNITAANYALFNIFQMLNSLKLFQKDMIDPHRNNPAIFVEMQPLLQEEHADFQFDFKNLSFLLITKYKLLLIDLFIEQQRYKQAINAINYRSSLHMDKVQPALTRAGIREKVDYPVEAFLQALGPLLFRNLQVTTDHVVREVDHSVASLENAKNKMVKGFKELFPEGNFLNFELTE